MKIQHINIKLPSQFNVREIAKRRDNFQFQYKEKNNGQKLFTIFTLSGNFYRSLCLSIFQIKTNHHRYVQ